MERQFLYLQNVWLNVGKRSIKKAIRMSTFHDMRLAARVANPYYAAMYAVYHPIHLALLAAYVEWLISGGAKKGATDAFRQLLALLAFAKINQWDVEIQAVYPKRNASYIAILPLGHKPFQSGTYQDRILTVDALSGSLTGIGALAATKTDVDDFLSMLNTAHDAQGTDFGNREVDSGIVHAAVTTAMEAMYVDFTSCLNQFPTNPAEYEGIFDIDEVRKRMQTFFTGNVLEFSSDTVCKRTLKPVQRIRMKNNGAKQIFLCAMEAKNQPGTGGFGVGGGGIEVEVNVSELGNIAVNKYITVYNPNDTPADFEITILKK